jgi:hypothetical protein
LQTGGQGAGQQQASVGLNQYEQSKVAELPLHGGGILTTAFEYPRQILASLPGISLADVEQLENSMKQKRSAKDQKDVIRDLLRVAADNIKDTNPTLGAAGSLFNRAVEAESLLHAKEAAEVPDLPEKLITRSQMEKAHRKENQPDVYPQGLSAFQL